MISISVMEISIICVNGYLTEIHSNGHESHIYMHIYYYANGRHNMHASC